MITQALQFLFHRDLTRLKTEIEAYRQEENLWKIAGNIANPAGNLCLHLIGNLNTYIGRELGGTGYVRNRELEFSAKYVSRAELLQKLEETTAIVNTTLNQLNDAELEKEYPLLVLEEKTNTGFVLIHLTTHLAYHLGQINYHRRLLDE